MAERAASRRSVLQAGGALLAGSAAGALPFAPRAVAQVPPRVSVSGDRLLVEGHPFHVRGATGNGPLPLLAMIGGNTLRTYGEDPAATLDAAQAAGLKVIVGFWLGHPRLGADYTDAGFVARQLDELAALVRRHRHHPALLMWGIGNEVEVGLDDGDDALVWPAIGAAAALVKSLDPEHPRMAVLAELGGGKLGRLMAGAPDIDVLGVNSYGEALPSVPGRARAQGWTGPIVITEAGPLGQWQAATTPWGAPFEPTSTQKSILMRRHLAVLEPTGVGIVAFLWGQKQEVTPTWHSLFLPSGEWTETVEALAGSWGGSTPGGNHAPRITELRFAHDPSAPFGSWPAAAGGAVVLGALDPDGDPLDVRWRVMAESTARGIGGDAETVPAEITGAVIAGDLAGARIGPLPAGRYRLFVELRDGRGAAATGNLPFEAR
ncbi:glycoside hydrolase 5 family protein [Ancylobacter terrae]|uniref:glycosyl hydrolase n=1 Tax=Ancylobacter sp. sgz301288 TaxID=3342077 RepID=UPI00385F6C54